MGQSRKCFLILSVLACTIIAPSCGTLLSAQNYNFQDFVRQFNRTYLSAEEYQIRQMAFQQNYLKILQEEAAANGSYHVTVNNFTDWTQTQLDSYFTYKPQKSGLLFSLKSSRLTSALAYPASLDYKAMGKVSDVKNQLQCGDCWAFATVGLYQSLLLIQTNQMYDLAEQYVLDCTSGSSCNGGYPKDAIDMFVQTGIPLETAYPYKQQYRYYGSGICSATSRVKLNTTVTSVKHYNSMTDAQLKQALADHGPVAIGVYASSSFSSYSTGVYSGCPASSSSYINHAVLLVGYTAQGHWIVKNSWGTDWGVDGYITIHKDYDCGLKTFVDVVTLADPAPSPSPSPSPNPSPNPSPDPSPNPSPSPDPSPTPSPNSTYVNYTAHLIDNYGDGWGGLILGVRQGTITSTLGQGFTNGSTFGPVNILVKQNIFAELVVVQMANWTNQVSFDVYDEKGTLVYTRECRAGKFQSTVIFTTWCPGSGCLAPNSSSVFVTLLDSWGDGWNGNTIGLKQAGNITATFGNQFTNGHSLGPVQVKLTYGIQADIIVNTLGSWRAEVGFAIRDPSGTLLFQRRPGVGFYANTLFGSICVSCVNYAHVRLAAPLPEDAAKSYMVNYDKQGFDKYANTDNTSQSSPSTNNSSTQETTLMQIGTKNGFSTQAIIIIGVIGFFTLFFMVATIVLFTLWRNQRANKFFRLQTEQNLLANNSGMGFQTANTTQLGMTSVRSNISGNQGKYKVDKFDSSRASPGAEQLFILG